MQSTIIETIIGQPIFVDNMDDQLLDLLVDASELKYSKKIEKSDIYSSTPDTFIIAKGTNDTSYESAAATYTYVSTPEGTSVLVYIHGEELTTAKIAEFDAYVTTYYPNATLLRSATTNYNCHSYAWYSRLATNKYWMNDPSAYMSDGSYTQIVLLPAIVSLNTIVYYNNSDHSAVVTTAGPPGALGSLIKVTSKWGSYGLVQHNVSYSPYTYSGFTLWN